MTIKQARDLVAGDVLAATNREVVRGAQVGARTPSGKCDLVLRNLDGKCQGEEYLVVWGRYTNIGIK